MKKHFTLDYLTKAQAQGLWPEVLKKNRRHVKDEPGFHADKGLWVDQLRYHDSRGVLRGVLHLHHQKAEERVGTKFAWDNSYEQPGFLWIAVDPGYLRQGVGTALLCEAQRLGWNLNFDKQKYTPAGKQLVLSYMRKKQESSH